MGEQQPNYRPREIMIEAVRLIHDDLGNKISEEDALAKWQVHPEFYWQAAETILLDSTKNESVVLVDDWRQIFLTYLTSIDDQDS